MLVLTRKPDQSVVVSDFLKITIVAVKGQQVRIGIEAPACLKVLRGELLDQDVVRAARQNLDLLYDGPRARSG